MLIFTCNRKDANVNFTNIPFSAIRFTRINQFTYTQSGEDVNK